MLNIVDDVTRECLAAIPDTSISGRRVARELTDIIAWRGKPMQNGYVESFNGRMRDELLNETLFHGLDHARAVIREWVEDYNGCRPHSSIGYLTPAAYAETIFTTGSGMPDPVVSTAPHGVTITAAALISAG